MRDAHPKLSYLKLFLALPRLLLPLLQLAVLSVGELVKARIDQVAGRENRVDVDPVSHDREMQQLIDGRTTQEVRAWLSTSPRNSIYGYRARKSGRIANKLYSLGAKRVWAVEIRSYESGELTRTLVVELPDDPVKRKHLFSWEYRHAKSMSFDGTADCGQSFMLAYWT